MFVRRPLLVTALLTALTTAIFIARYGVSTSMRKIATAGGVWDPMRKEKGMGCTQDLRWMEPYQLTPEVNYVSRDIIIKPGAPDRPVLTKINKDLFGEIQVVESGNLSGRISINSCLPPLTLDVHHGSPALTDASNMIFAVQTTISRLQDTLKHLNRWLPYTGARLYCIVKQDEETYAKQQDMTALQKEFRSKGMNVTLLHPMREKDHFEQRYFSLVSVMYAARDAQTEWMITIDDDTFFPSLDRLKNELQHLDPSKEHYLGALSEDWGAVNMYGLMAFGGASIIMSVPMVKVLDEHKNECADHPRTSAGDITIMDCICRFSTTKLTNIPELYQMDIKHDRSGFYESGRPILSIHHWKGGDANIDLHKTHLVADICDDCFLQRWQFRDDLILSNAYSIHTYPLGHLRGTSKFLGTGKDPAIEKLNLLAMEETWAENPNVRHSLDPLRPRLGEDAKRQYRILDSMFVKIRGMGAVRQVYVRRAGDKGGNDEVMVLNWIREKKL